LVLEDSRHHPTLNTLSRRGLTLRSTPRRPLLVRVTDARNNTAAGLGCSAVSCYYSTTNESVASQSLGEFNSTVERLS